MSSLGLQCLAFSALGVWVCFWIAALTKERYTKMFLKSWKWQVSMAIFSGIAGGAFLKLALIQPTHYWTIGGSWLIDVTLVFLFATIMCERKKRHIGKAKNKSLGSMLIS